MEKTEKNDSYSHILKYTGIFGGVQGLSILCGLTILVDHSAHY